MSGITVIHENSAWVEPLRAAFDELGLPLTEWFLDQGVIPFDSEPPAGVFYNRMSASSHTRGHRFAPELTHGVLNWLETYGRRVVNNHRALYLEVSKLAQYAALQRVGIKTPRTVAAVGRRAGPASRQGLRAGAVHPQAEPRRQGASGSSCSRRSRRSPPTWTVPTPQPRRRSTASGWSRRTSAPRSPSSPAASSSAASSSTRSGSTPATASSCARPMPATSRAPSARERASRRRSSPSPPTSTIRSSKATGACCGTTASRSPASSSSATGPARSTPTTSTPTPTTTPRPKPMPGCR